MRCPKMNPKRSNPQVRYLLNPPKSNQKERVAVEYFYQS